MKIGDLKVLSFDMVGTPPDHVTEDLKREPLVRTKLDT